MENAIPSPSQSLVRFILGSLMLTQTLGWGSSQALIGALAQPIALDLSLPPTVIYGGVTVMFTIGALCAPFAGRLADRLGGAPLLVAGSLLIAVGLTLLSASRGLYSYLGAWIVLGLGMHLALATSALALLSQVSGDATRRNIAFLSLAMGLSSSISWPVAAVLELHFGWRVTCLFYAGANLILAMPLHLLAALVAHRMRNTPGTAEAAPVPPAIETGKVKLAFLLTGMGVTLMAMVSITMSIMLIDILTGIGLPRPQAVAAASLLGIAYVTGRVLDLYFERRMNPVSLGVVIYVAVFLAIVPLFLWAFTSWSMPFAFAALLVLAYGIPAGLFTILRPTLVLYLFGSASYGHRIGHLYRYADTANALAPAAIAPLLAMGAGLALGAVLIPAGLATAAMIGLRNYVHEPTPKSSEN